MPRLRRTSVGRDLQSIRRSLASIVSALARLAPALQSLGRDPAPSTSSGRRKLKLSPARRASLKLQGQYMGYLRSLKPKQKARVKALRVTRGVGPAIRLARKLARGANQG